MINNRQLSLAILPLTLLVFIFSGCFGGNETIQPKNAALPTEISEIITFDPATLPEDASIYLNGFNQYQLYYLTNTWKVKAVNPNEVFLYQTPDEDKFKIKILVKPTQLSTLETFLSRQNVYEFEKWIKINDQKFAQVKYDLATSPDQPIYKSPVYLAIHKNKLYTLYFPRCSETSQAECDLILSTFEFYTD